MATYMLRPQDGGKDIVIPCGKTTIGRGSFLGVTDKRVSRSHAELELNDGNLTVLPLHINPTFYKASVKEKFVALKKNEAHELVSGGVISLLPDALCFEVVCEGGSSKNGLTTEPEETISQSRTTNDVPSISGDNNEKPTASHKVPTESFLDEFMDSRPSVEPVPASSTQAVKYNKDPVPEFAYNQSQSITSNKNTVLSSKPEVKPAVLLQKTRKLPSWLIQSTSSGTKSPANKEGNRKGKTSTSKTQKTTATSNKAGKTIQKSAPVAQQKQNRLGSDDDFIVGEVDDEEDGTLKQKQSAKTTAPMKRTCHNPESDDDIRPVRHKKTKQISSDSDEETLPLQAAKKQDAVKPAEPVLRDESSGSDEDVKPSSAKKRSETKVLAEEDELPLCPYGSKCYRKNPVHFKEYSHPDEDSKVDEEASDGSDDSDGRPECPYGTSCYRTNPQHKRDYKHTKTLGHPKRKKSSALNNASDDDGPNTYDYNDSFLDDADSDGSYSAGSDDSDWEPQGEDDDVDDDVNELLSEARGFLRSKNMTKPV